MSEAMKFRKRPVVIEAMLNTGVPRHTTKILDWINGGPGKSGVATYDPTGTPSMAIYIETPEGTMRADRGDWIIQGVQGEFYPCKPDIFEATYEAV